MEISPNTPPNTAKAAAKETTKVENFSIDLKNTGMPLDEIQRGLKGLQVQPGTEVNLKYTPAYANTSTEKTFSFGSVTIESRKRPVAGWGMPTETVKTLVICNNQAQEILAINLDAKESLGKLFIKKLE